MKALKIILGIAIGLLLTVLLIAALLPKDYSVERQLTIERPKEAVFTYVKYLKNQENYSKWARVDPDMKKTYRGTDGTVGFVSAWDSQKDEVGAGEQEIIGIAEGERIDYELRFFRPFESTEPAYMLTEALNDTLTQVRWGFQGHMEYPMNVLIPLMNLEEMIGNDLETGLKQLKQVLENGSHKQAAH